MGKKKLTKSQREEMEFDRDGRWVYVYAPTPKKKMPVTAAQWKRMEKNRLAAQRKLAAVKRWKEQQEFDSNDPTLKPRQNNSRSP